MAKKVLKFSFTLLTMLCLGLVYGWSIFVVPLEAEFGWERSETSLTFSISMISMVIGIMLGGQFNKKKDKAFYTLIIAAVMLFIGFAMASRAQTLLHFYLSYGVLCGFGVGFAYVEMIAIPTKWFKECQGVTSGVLMMCFGLGAMILGTICSNLMSSIGWRQTFLILGTLFGIMVLVDGIILQSTVKSNKKTGNAEMADDDSLTTKDMIMSTDFKLLYIWHIFISAAGLALMGHISPCVMQMGASASTAALIAGVVSVSNGGGRIIYGILYDRIGVKKTLLTICSIFMIATIVSVVAVSIRNITLLIAGCVLVGMSFGAAPTSSSAVVNRFYGPRYFSANFGVISTMLIIAALIGPLFAGKLYTITENYLATFYGMTVFGVISFILIFFVLIYAKKNNRNLT